MDIRQSVIPKRTRGVGTRLFLGLSVVVLGVSGVRNIPHGSAIGPPNPPVFYVSCAQFELPLDSEVETSLNYESKMMTFDWEGIANTRFTATVPYLSSPCLGNTGVRTRTRDHLTDYVSLLIGECGWLRSEVIRYDQTGVGIKAGSAKVNRQAVPAYLDQWCSPDHGGLDGQIAQLS